MKALEWSQHYTAIFQTLKCSLLCKWWSSVGVLDTCKTEEDPIKNEGARVVIKRSPIVCLCRYFNDAQGQLNPQSEVGST